MSVSVTSRRLSDGHQPQPPLPHAVTPPSPDASKVSHGPFSSSSSPSSSPQQTLPQRRPSKPVEEQKQAEPHLISRLSTSNASSSVYSSSSLSSSVQQHYQHSLPDTSHHSVVSFAPLPAVAAVHSSLFPVTHLAADAHNNPTASTASHSSTNSYLPAAHPAHPHSDTEDDVDEEEEVEEAGEGEEGEYEDEEESVDDSPRDGRILTFADEHGVQLCNFYVYDPTAVQNVTPRPEKQSGPGSGSSSGESDRRKESGKVTRIERTTDAEANCQCCIS